MSFYNVCYTRNSYHYSLRCPQQLPGGEEALTLFGAVLLRAVCTVKVTLFVPSERARASTQGGEEQIKIYYVQSCSAQSCSGSLCSFTLRELEPLHKECIYLICVILLCHDVNFEMQLIHE